MPETPKVYTPKEYLGNVLNVFGTVPPAGTDTLVMANLVTQTQAYEYEFLVTSMAVGDVVEVQIAVDPSRWLTVMDQTDVDGWMLLSGRYNHVRLVHTAGATAAVVVDVIARQVAGVVKIT